MSKNHPQSRSPAHIFLFVFGFGLLALLHGQVIVTDTRDYLASDTWATTTGTRIRDNNKAAFIDFEYTVNGERYVGTRSRFYQVVLFTGDSQYSQIDDQYVVGEQFTVHYDPEDPQRAVIDPTFPTVRALFALFVVGVVFPFLFVVSRFFRRLGNTFRVGGR